jgi:apolipoprotein N-acyltransferase
MRLLKTALLIGALLAIAFLFIMGCGLSNTAYGKKADIRGNITNITKTTEQNIIGSILVEGNIEKDTKFDKASITITRQTRIFEYKDSKLVKAHFASLQIGQKVQALFTGQVLESYPVQVKAIEVVILE